MPIIIPFDTGWTIALNLIDTYLPYTTFIMDLSRYCAHMFQFISKLSVRYCISSFAPLEVYTNNTQGQEPGQNKSWWRKVLKETSQQQRVMLQ